MALKPTRITGYGNDAVAYFMQEVAERGIVVVWDGAATGSLGNLDDPNAVVAIPTSTDGVPVGVLTNDVVQLDLTRTHLNQHRDEVQVNGKVAVMKHGTVQTNMLVGGDAPVPGDVAYYTAAGLFTTTAGSLPVGRFTSAVDADGYVVVDVRL